MNKLLKVTAPIMAGLFLVGTVLTTGAYAYPAKIPFDGGTVHIDDNKHIGDQAYDYVIRIQDKLVNGRYVGKGKPLMFDANSSNSVQHLISFIQAMDSAQYKVKIEIAGIGGQLPMMYELFEAIQQSPADITMHVVGGVGSAHALIAVSGDKIKVSPGVNFMFHMPSFGPIDGKMHKLCKPGVKAPNYFIQPFAVQVCTKFTYFIDKHVKYMLSDGQYKSLIAGEDVHVNGIQIAENFKGLSKGGPLTIFLNEQDFSVTL